MRKLLLVLFTASLAFAPKAALSWDRDDDHGRPHWKDRGDDDRDRHRRYGDSCFREDHLRIIHDYYRPRNLPPGLEKKFYRTGHLPPGWERRIHPFPYEIERRLPPVCAGCARGYMDGYAIVYQPRTRLIIDFHAVVGP